MVLPRAVVKHPTGESSSSRICLIALRFQLFIAFTERKREVPFSMAIGNGELMQVFPQTLAHGNSKNEIRQRQRRQEERRECGKKQSGHEKKKSRRSITS